MDVVEGGGRTLRTADPCSWNGINRPLSADVSDDGLKLRAEWRGKIRKEKYEEAKACKI